MLNSRRFLFACLLSWGLLLAGPMAAAATSLPPPQAFFDEGSVQDMRMSPNGRWVAAQVVPAEGGNTRLVLMDLQGKEAPMVLAAFSRANVRGVRWVNDEMLLVTATADMHKGREPKYPALLSVSRDGKNMRLLIKAEFDTLFAAHGAHPLEANHHFLALGEPGSDEIIVGETQYDGAYEPKSTRPLVLNVRTGARRSLLDEQPKFATDYLFDHRGRARLAISYSENVGSYHWLDLDTKKWKQLAEFENLQDPYWPMFVDGAGQLYVQVSRSDGSGAQLRRFDFATGKPGAEVLVETPGFDTGIGGKLDRSRGELLGFSVLTDATQDVWLAPEIDALQKKVDAGLPGRVNRLLCARCDKLESVLVYSYSDRAPGDFLLYKQASNEWMRLGSRRPKLDAVPMARQNFHRIKARDGADLPVWVTQPPGPAKQARAAVVLVHGGPWSRGSQWGWDPEVQFLASRGYVVIEPEFRGSTGYGDSHFRAGFRQWGQTMQDDVSDALQFAARQGWVDPSRACIAGASYGGYATLMGLAKRPDEFRCGVAWVAVSDPRLMFSVHWSDIHRDAKKYSMKTMIGDPEKDAAMLAANSPLELVDRIKAPLLLAYGGKDMRVPLVHGTRMRDALAKAGRPPEWVVYDDEGHTWRQEENIVDFWKRVETFLAKHLPP